MTNSGFETKASCFPTKARARKNITSKAKCSGRGRVVALRVCDAMLGIHAWAAQKQGMQQWTDSIGFRCLFTSTTDFIEGFNFD